MNNDALTALTRARVSLIIDQPFFGNLALRLQLKETTEIPTLATDGRYIYYNPDFVLSLRPRLQTAAVAHEVEHVVLEHISRIGGRDKKKWNYAADYRVNYDLKAAGFEIAPDWLYDPKYADLSTDHIYSLLPDDFDKGEKGGTGSPGGSGDGGQRPLDEILPSPDEPGSEAAEQQALEWKVAVAQAAQQARMQGKLPAHIERLVNEILGGKVDWRAALWRFADEITKADYAWTRPNRRYLPHGYILPSLHSPAMGTMVAMVDTSGSVDGALLEAFGAELRAIKDALRPKQMYVIYADAAVQKVDLFEEDDELVIAARGGGGTNFVPAFDWLEEHNIHPACAVYLTDMYGTFPREAPEYPVLWCATTNEVAPWGETVRIEI